MSVDESYGSSISQKRLRFPAGLPKPRQSAERSIGSSSLIGMRSRRNKRYQNHFLGWLIHQTSES
jgi:hypothetical protein